MACRVRFTVSTEQGRSREGLLDTVSYLVRHCAAGKTIGPRRLVITGASSGIGEALARYYASPDTVPGADRPPVLSSTACPARSFPTRSMCANELLFAAAASDFIGRFGAPDPRHRERRRVGRAPSVKRSRTWRSLAHVPGGERRPAWRPPLCRHSHRPCAAPAAALSLHRERSPGFRGLAGNGAYSASKAAARVWTESLRTEPLRLGVWVV